MDEGKAKCPNLRKAILAAQKAVGSITKSRTAEIKGKDGKKKYEYNFAGGEDIVAHGLQALHDQGVSWEIECFAPTEPNGKWLCLTVGLFHEPSEEYEQRKYYMPITGFGDADKVFSGTVTYCKGYAMPALLGIVRTDDKSARGADHRGRHVGNDSPRWEPGDQYPADQPPEPQDDTPDQHYTRLKLELGSVIQRSSFDYARVCDKAGIDPKTIPSLGHLKNLVAAAKALVSGE